MDMTALYLASQPVSLLSEVLLEVLHNSLDEDCQSKVLQRSEIDRP